MKKLLVGLALISFVFVTTVSVNAASVDQQVKATKEIKAEKKDKKACCTETKAAKKACCADKAAKTCDDAKKCDAKKDTKKSK